MKNPNNPCLFCNTSKKEIIFENNLAFVAFDSYPVSQFHSLIISKRHIHLIPRRVGDVDNPQGVVRSVIPSRQHYVRKSK